MKRFLSLLLSVLMLLSVLPFAALADEPAEDINSAIGEVTDELNQKLEEDKATTVKGEASEYPWGGLTDKEFKDYVFASENADYLTKLLTKTGSNENKAFRARVRSIEDNATRKAVQDHLDRLISGEDNDDFFPDEPDDILTDAERAALDSGSRRSVSDDDPEIATAKARGADFENQFNDKIGQEFNSCSHSKAVYDEDLYCYFEGDSKDNGNGTHTGVKRTYYGGYCPDCGNYVEKDVSRETITEPHSWSNDGECYDCGATNPCKHSNVVFGDSINEDWNNAVDNGDGTHTGIKITYYSEECPDCGQYVEQEVSREKATEPHKWDSDGECWICGAINTCNHENIHCERTPDAYWENVVDNKNGTHTGTKITYYPGYCVDCKQSIKKEISREITTEAHEWDSMGDCWTCGAVNTCKHAHIKYEVYYYVEWEYAVDNGNGTHTGVQIKTNPGTCLDCGQYVLEEFFRETVTDYHEWSNGRCSYCRAKNECKHKNAEYSKDPYYSWYCADDNGDGTHTGIRINYKYCNCPDCGEYIEKEVSRETATAPHEWWNGRCDCCNAYNFCTHPNPTSEKTSYWYTLRPFRDNKDGTHTGEMYYADEYTCPDCGEVWDENETHETVTEEHRFNNGACEICGAKQKEDSGTCGSKLTWKMDLSGTLTISGSGAMKDFDAKTGAPWHKYAKSINKIILPSGLTNIGSYAFAGCDALKSITIPSKVKTIGAGAFINCRSLTSVTVPKNVKTIEKETFAGCESLKSVMLPEKLTGIGNGAFEGCGLTSVTIPKTVKSIGESAFFGCALTSLTTPDSVTSIGKKAFGDCRKLASVTLPANIKSIEDETFAYCTALKTAIIPYGVTKIGAEAFMACKSLTSVTLPGSIKSIDNYAFSGCEKMKDAYFKGSKSQWNSVSIAGNNDPLKNASLHCEEILPPTVTVSGKKAAITWKQMSGATGYMLYVRRDNESNPMKTATVKKGTTLKYSISGLVPGHSYSFSLAAIINGSIGAKSTETTVEVPLDTPKLKAKVKNNVITLSWSAVKGTAGYELKVTDSAGNTKTEKLGAAAKKATLTVAPSGAYTISLTAYAGQMTSKTVTVKGTVSLTATTLKAKASKGTVNLSWKQVKTADAYEIYRAEGNSGDFKLIATVGGTVKKYVDRGVTVGTTYTYKLRPVSKNTYAYGTGPVYGLYTAAVKITAK